MGTAAVWQYMSTHASTYTGAARMDQNSPRHVGRVVTRQPVTRNQRTSHIMACASAHCVLGSIESIDFRPNAATRSIRLSNGHTLVRFDCRTWKGCSIRRRIECQEIRFDIRKTWHRMNLSIRFPFVRCPSLPHASFSIPV